MGEMVAWSDFIAALYGLGHDLRVITNGHTLRQMLARSDQPIFDLVYTDYLGLTAFEGDNLFSRYKCRLRYPILSGAIDQLNNFYFSAEFTTRSERIHCTTFELRNTVRPPPLTCLPTGILKTPVNC